MRSGKTSVSKVLGSLLTGVLTASVLAACSPSGTSSANINPVHTGTIEAEGEVGAVSAGSLRRGETLYISSEQVRVRKTPEINDSNIVGMLQMNDEVQVVSASLIGSDQFISVKVIASGDAELKGKIVYMSIKYLNPKALPRLSPSTALAESSPSHFVVTNVATEMVRLYRKCVAPETCKNKMLMQFHATVGNNSEGRRSDVGVYRTNKWIKFYEVAGEYPGWYRPGYPELPKVGSRGAWLSKDVKPDGFSGPRGAFGWYTVFVEPNNEGQWMHGTTGWGADKSKMVRFQDSFAGGLAGIFAKLGSHGCTRLSNEAIAYMRSNLPVGSTYLKIYANERVKDESLSGYSRDLGHFPYIITKLGYGKSNTQHDLSARASVIAAGTPESEWLEQGQFDYDQTPKAFGGDHYKIKQFSGAFNVDEGTLTNDYRHPVSDRSRVGGYPGREKALPAFVRDDEIAPKSAPLASNENDDN